MEVLRYKWRAGDAVWLSHELLMEMKVATLYCFVGGNSIQRGAVDDSEASFFLNIKYGNFIASPSVHIATLGSLVDRPIYSMLQVSIHCSPSITCLGFLYAFVL